MVKKMTFISLSFIAFLFVGIIFFYICPVKFRWVMLLALSLCFYAQSDWRYLPFILFSTLSIYGAGLFLGALHKKQELALKKEGLGREEKKNIKEKGKRARKLVLLGALVLNIGILCIVKFAKFFVGPINSISSLLGGEGEFSAAAIIVPLGISYYTFSTVGYLLDIYWKRYEPEKNYLRFLLFAIYFPHILQGPIARYNKLGLELKKELNFDFDRCLKGVELMLWGFFKKLVIADRVKIFTDGIFEPHGANLGLLYIIAMLVDVVYIYCDFSGCVDIARGASQIFGVELENNFNRPFLAKSVPEFWRRWHMTLGAWFRDYVYMPVSTSNLVKNVGKSLKAKNVNKNLVRIVITAIPVYVTWILTGLWHGTGTSYLVWGFYYATVIGLSVCFSDSYQAFLKKHGVKTETISWRVIQTVKVVCVFAGGRIFTTPGSLSFSKTVIQSIIHNFNPWIFTNGTFWKYNELDGANTLIAVLAIALLIAVDLIKENLGEKSLRDRIREENVFTRVILTVLLTVAIFVFGIYGEGYDASSFAYMSY